MRVVRSSPLQEKHNLALVGPGQIFGHASKPSDVPSERHQIRQVGRPNYRPVVRFHGEYLHSIQSKLKQVEKRCKVGNVESWRRSGTFTLPGSVTKMISLWRLNSSRSRTGFSSDARPISCSTKPRTAMPSSCSWVNWVVRRWTNIASAPTIQYVFYDNEYKSRWRSTSLTIESRVLMAFSLNSIQPSICIATVFSYLQDLSVWKYSRLTAKIRELPNRPDEAMGWMGRVS